MKQNSKLQKILNLLNKDANLGYRASYLAEYAGVSNNTIHPLLVSPVLKGQIEKVVITRKEVYYIKPLL